MTTRPRRTLMLITTNTHYTGLRDTLQVDTGDYDVIFVEPMANGYSRIREVAPDLVIVHFDTDDIVACRLLSMLTVDHDLRGVRVMTLVTPAERSQPEEDFSTLEEEPPRSTLIIQMN